MAQTRKTTEKAPLKTNSLPPVIRRMYPYWFYIPAGLVFGIFFLLPTALAFYFSLTRWTLFDSTFIGFDNYEYFFRDPQLTLALRNTLIFAFITSGLKIIISLPVAVLLTSGLRLQTFFRSVIFFPCAGECGCSWYYIFEPHAAIRWCDQSRTGSDWVTQTELVRES